MLLPSLLTAAALGNSNFMDCGGAPICGVLTLETGYGSGRYQHAEPVVHGLWPQVDKYGNSACVSPRDRAPPSALASCYQQSDVDADDALRFEQHEWSKHGVCAGADDAVDYLGQLCALARPPLAALASERRAGLGLDDMASDLRRRGFPVWAVDGRNSQVELSACASASGRWRLAPVSEMGRTCAGSAAGSPSVVRYEGAAPGAVEPRGCLPSKRGPPCTAATDCNAAPGCARCAKSGFCTDVPL